MAISSRVRSRDASPHRETQDNPADNEKSVAGLSLFLSGIMDITEFYQALARATRQISCRCLAGAECALSAGRSIASLQQISIMPAMVLSGSGCRSSGLLELQAVVLCEPPDELIGSTGRTSAAFVPGRRFQGGLWCF